MGSEAQRHAIHAALATKDASALARLSVGLQPAARDGLLALVDLYGDVSVLDRAASRLPDYPEITQALAQLRWLAEQIPGVAVSFDLGDSRGYAYYSGMRFAIYAKGASDALARGGRYDGVGAVFGHRIDRDRPAVGFSLDLKALATLTDAGPAGGQFTYTANGDTANVQLQNPGRIAATDDFNPNGYTGASDGGLTFPERIQIEEGPGT